MKASRIFPFVCIALLLSVLFLFSSCGGNGDETAAATSAPSEYAVTFSVNGVETSVTVAAGEMPEYSGETSWETEEHFYKITGWEPALAPAAADVTYTAVIGEYGLTVYKVRFNMPDGTFPTVMTHEGEMPTPPEGYETDYLKNPGMVGIFDHWTPEMVAPTAENMKDKKGTLSSGGDRYLNSLKELKDGYEKNPNGIHADTYVKLYKAVNDFRAETSEASSEDSVIQEARKSAGAIRKTLNEQNRIDKYEKIARIERARIKEKQDQRLKEQSVKEQIVKEQSKKGQSIKEQDIKKPKTKKETVKETVKKTEADLKAQHEKNKELAKIRRAKERLDRKPAAMQKNTLEK